MCFGVHFCADVLCFSGLATTDREKPRHVKFVDSIEKLTDFLEKHGHGFRTILYISCLGICCFFDDVLGFIFAILGVILKVIVGLQNH